MKSKLQITEAGVSDIPQVRKLAHEIWPDTFGEILSKEQLDYMLKMMYSHDSLQMQMEELGHVMLLVMVKEKTVGYAAYELNHKSQPNIKIHKIYLLPETQGLGFGKALLNKMVEIGIAAGQKSITLNVNRFNKALGFYKKIGFRQAATEDIDIGNGFLMEDAVMEMDL